MPACRSALEIPLMLPYGSVPFLLFVQLPFPSEISPPPRQSSLVHSEHFSTFFFPSKIRFPVFPLFSDGVVQCSLILLNSCPHQQFSIDRRGLTTGYVLL